MYKNKSMSWTHTTTRKVNTVRGPQVGEARKKRQLVTGVKCKSTNTHAHMVITIKKVGKV